MHVTSAAGFELSNVISHCLFIKFICLLNFLTYLNLSSQWTLVTILWCLYFTWNCRSLIIHLVICKVLFVCHLRTEDNFASRELLILHNTSKLAVHATLWLLNSATSDTFILDPTSLLLEPGQKQVDTVLLTLSTTLVSISFSFSFWFCAVD